MRQFGGEPLVGEIVGLRTFRVDDSGLLLPLYSESAWYDGPNTAACAPPTGRHDRPPHTVPADECECGFYAYGSPEAAAQNRQARHVQAVVSCWGEVVAGTQGFRGQHARIDALWLAPQTPAWLRVRVAVRYPSARVYRDATAMLAEHPLTALACYEPPPRRRRAAIAAGAAALLGVLALGALPMQVLRGNAALEAAWFAVGCAAALLSGWLLLAARGAGHVAAAFVVAGVLGWLVAPMFGLAGWLLRVPLLRGLLVGVGGYLLALWPRHFPVVRTPREAALTSVS